MIIDATEYDSATGAILSHVVMTPESLAANGDRTFFVGEHLDAQEWLIIGGVPVARGAALIDAERLASARAAALRDIRAEIDATADRITGLYPRAEKDSWPQKEAAALAIIAGTATAGDMTLIGAEAAVTGAPLGDLTGRIVANAAAFRQAIGMLSGLRSTTEAAVSVAQDVAEVVAAMNALRVALAQIEQGSAA